MISIPAVVVAVLYAKLVASKIDIPANSEYTLDELKEKYGKLPGTLHSFSPIPVSYTQLDVYKRQAYDRHH